ncbi:MAG: DUF3467 domain-containing protein [Coriobacteriales bacterium]|nr:DUF3467 domain-containing protein [Coriobacteriales bacterium]
MSNDQVKIRFEATLEKACGQYANSSIISTNGPESRIDFLYVDHPSINRETNEVPAHLVSRIIMPTSELARLSETLNNHLSKHLEKGLND